MNIPDFFYSNIDTLYPLLEEEEPLNTLLEPSPFSSHLSLRTSFWGKAYSCIWPGIGSSTASASEEQLRVVLERTMRIFQFVILDMLQTQEIYLRLFKANLNGSEPGTADLELCRSRLKRLYETVGPFARKLRKSNHAVSRELFKIISLNQPQEKDATKKFSIKLLSGLNKEIEALISFECAYGKLLPYGPLLLGIYSSEPLAIEIARQILPQTCSKIDFKITYRALKLIHSNSVIKLPPFDETFYYLYQNGISIINNPDYKLDAWRRSLKPGDSFPTCKDFPRYITLGERVSPPKEGHDGQIKFHIVKRTGSSETSDNEVIAFYPNKAYCLFINKRDFDESCGLHSISPHSLDPQFRWTIESYLEPKILPFKEFLSFVNFQISCDQMTAIDFSKIRHDEETHSLVTLSTISLDERNYAAFIDSLITYYKSGVYRTECPTLYEFMSTCLANAKPEYIQFFSQLAYDTAKIALSALPKEIDVVIGAAIGRKNLIAPKTDADSSDFTEFRQKCQRMVSEILEQRTALILNLRTSPGYTEAKETALLQTFINTLPKKVRSWIIPPPPQQKPQPVCGKSSS